MASTVELRVPDLGDFSDVEVIEILVGPGDELQVEDPVVTLETDKASMDVPATAAGKVVSMELAVGDKVSAGDLVLTMDVTGEPAFDSTVVMDPEEKEVAISGSCTPSVSIVGESMGPPTCLKVTTPPEPRTGFVVMPI